MLEELFGALKPDLWYCVQVLRAACRVQSRSIETSTSMNEDFISYGIEKREAEVIGNPIWIARSSITHSSPMRSRNSL